MNLADIIRGAPAIANLAIPASEAASNAPRLATIAKIAAGPSDNSAPNAASAADPIEAEIRALLAREMRGAGADHPDYPEALRIALADPGAALEALRSNCGRARNG